MLDRQRGFRLCESPQKYFFLCRGMVEKEAIRLLTAANRNSLYTFVLESQVLLITVFEFGDISDAEQRKKVP